MPVYRNQRLFSDHYLKEILPQSGEWKSVDKQKLNEAFARIQSLCQKKCKIISFLKESQLEEEFIRPILRILGHIYAPHPSIDKVWEGAREPDYAFYHSEEAKKEASIGKAIAIGEVKRYGRALGKKLKGEDPSEVQNPSLQMSRYLWLSEVRWGILTDGRFWRLYERETSKRIDIFYEIDLEGLLKKGNVEDFKYFYLFFCKEAFPEFLQRVYDKSLDYAEKVGEELKENVYQALKILAEGFLKTPENNLTPENLKKIHDNSLVLLYRLLFTLYAEYRRLLPLEENELYTDSYSLDSIKKEIRDKIDHNYPLSRAHTHYWDRLRELFGTINSGDPEIGVPFYNGGLFEPQKHAFLEEYRVADFYVAKVIDLLCRSKDKAFIDYSSLEARHLGSIYEGLLEYKIKIAQEALVATKKKGKEVFVPLREAKASGSKIRESEIIESGEPYVATDKGERKASGSYYTPEYIVKYIVENTLGPVIEKKKELIEGKMQELQKKFKSSRGYNREIFEKQLKQTASELVKELRKIKVLDPAMGSGHFLVEATDFLAHALVEALNSEVIFEPSQKEWLIRDKATSYEEDRDEDDIRWARREVVERCIYGVDLNPLAVELAKLSLWLYTVAKGKPLNFLDHHLKCGNSLIGARVDDLANLPELRKKKKREQIPTLQGILFDISPMTVDLGLAVGNYFLIEDKLSDSLEDIKDKEKIYQNINRKWIGKWQAVGDLWISSYFGVKLDPALYKALSDYLLGKSKRIPQEWVKDFVDKASKIAKEKRFFHWELEFPEVFFDRQGEKLENSGFDVVVGNPPYGAEIEIQERFFIDEKFASSTKDSAAYFLELSSVMARQYFGMIIPKSIAFYDNWKSIRHFLLNKSSILNLMDCGLAFPDVNYEQMAICFSKSILAKEAHIYLAEPLRRPLLQKQVTPKSKVPSKWMKRLKVIIFRSIDEKIDNVLEKIMKTSVPLGRVPREVFRGLYIPDAQKEKILKEPLYFWPKIAKGEVIFINKVPDVKRYSIEQFWKISVNDLSKEQRIKAKKILRPRVFFKVLRGKRLVCYPDREGKLLTTEKLVNLIIKNTIDLNFIVAIINSFIPSFWIQYVLFSKTTETSRVLDDSYLKRIPIPCIILTTPKEEREKLVKGGKKLYEKYLENGNWDSPLFFVDQRLKRQHSPDPDLVKKHNADPLNRDFQIKEDELVEQSDVVHDLLAFLAEKMIDYNKGKNKETKSFLGWLEREIGAKVEDLTGKTIIKKYHETTGDSLISILKKNKKKLYFDPSCRDFQDKLFTEFDKSLQKLIPVKRKIEITDHLIDQIVYKLYGLTEEEVRVVEENFRK